MSAASGDLERWLNDPDHPGRSQEKLGKILGVSQSAVSQWKTGRAKPEPDLRPLIEALTGIPAASWYTADELARIERVRAAVEAGKAEAA